MSDMRSIWNAIERLAAINVTMARDAYDAVSAIRDAVYARASEEDVAGGAALAECAAFEAIEAAERGAAVALSLQYDVRMTYSAAWSNRSTTLRFDGTATEFDLAIQRARAEFTREL